MVFTFNNLVGGLVFLVLGVACLALFRRFIYPVLSARYERAKATATQGRNPAELTRLVYLLGLVALPLLGFLLGGLIFDW